MTRLVAMGRPPRTRGADGVRARYFDLPGGFKPDAALVEEYRSNNGEEPDQYDQDQHRDHDAVDSR